MNPIEDFKNYILDYMKENSLTGTPDRYVKIFGDASLMLDVAIQTFGKEPDLSVLKEWLEERKTSTEAKNAVFHVASGGVFPAEIGPENMRSKIKSEIYRRLADLH